MHTFARSPVSVSDVRATQTNASARMNMHTIACTHMHTRGSAHERTPCTGRCTRRRCRRSRRPCRVPCTPAAPRPSIPPPPASPCSPASRGLWRLCRPRRPFVRRRSFVGAGLRERPQELYSAKPRATGYVHPGVMAIAAAISRTYGGLRKRVLAHRVSLRLFLLPVCPRQLMSAWAIDCGTSGPGLTTTTQT